VIRIGEFSKLSRVSIRMLRYYDEIGLLKPAEIDRFTDYRYYSAEQLTVVGRITALKDMGFALADIARIMDVYDDAEAVDGYLAARAAELSRIADETAYRLRLIASARDRLRRNTSMNFDITVKTIPERYAACVEMTVPTYEDEAAVWNVMNEETEKVKITEDEPCLCAVSFLDPDYRERDIHMLAWKTVKGRYADTERLSFRTLPEVRVASCTYKGGYDGIDAVYAAMFEWIEANGYEMNGAMFNIYHVSPHETQNPDEFVTEVCLPITQK